GQRAVDGHGEFDERRRGRAAGRAGVDVAVEDQRARLRGGLGVVEPLGGDAVIVGDGAGGVATDDRRYARRLLDGHDALVGDDVAGADIEVDAAELPGARL